MPSQLDVMRNPEIARTRRPSSTTAAPATRRSGLDRVLRRPYQNRVAAPGYHHRRRPARSRIAKSPNRIQLHQAARSDRVSDLRNDETHGRGDAIRQAPPRRAQPSPPAPLRLPSPNHHQPDWEDAKYRVISPIMSAVKSEAPSILSTNLSFRALTGHDK